jgi:hypothetical protein
MVSIRSLHRTPVLSLSQLTENWTSPFVLTPRSKEVCASEGILQEELCSLPRESFFDQNVPEIICNIRWNHYNEKRRATIELLQEAYKRQASNSELEVPTDQGKQVQSKMFFNPDSGLKGSAEDSVGCMKGHKEALAKRHKKNITQMLLHEFYWQIKFEENQKVRQVSSSDENSQNLDGPYSSLNLSSTVNRHRKEKIMLTNRRDAERAQRAAEMRAISEKLQEERRKEVCDERCQSPGCARFAIF